MPDVGDSAPDFELESTEGTLRLSERVQHGRVLLAFYFEDATPSCSTEIATLADVYEPIQSVGGDIVAVSADSVASHRLFAQRMNAPFPLVSDPDLHAAKAYDVVSEEDPKRSRRALFVIDEDGTIVHAANSFSPNSLAQLEDVLRAIGIEL